MAPPPTAPTPEPPAPAPAPVRAPLTPEQARALTAAQELLARAQPDREALRQALDGLFDALDPRDPEHQALVDGVVALLRRTETDWSAGGLELLESLARTGGRPGDRSQAERLSQSLGIAARYSEDFSWAKSLPGYVALVRLDVDPYGGYVGFERSDGEELAETLELRYLRALSALERFVERDQLGPTEELLEFARDPRLGPTVRARALNAVSSATRDPARRIALLEEARALDPGSIPVELALSQARLHGSDGPAALPAHRAAWERWYAEFRSRDGANRVEQDLVVRSLRALVPLERFAEAHALVDAYGARWPDRMFVENMHRLVDAWAKGAPTPANEAWLRGPFR
ncbi:MAG: hypothetical protein R3F62_23460 [Planctomycetota bacterium]